MKEVIRATVNELTAASAADELSPDIELDEARPRRVFDAALAERTAQELLADEVVTKPKDEEGQAQEVSCVLCTRWQPQGARGGIQVLGT